MKGKIGNRKIYAVLFAVYIVLLIGMLIYYKQMSNKIFVVKGTSAEADRSGICIMSERSKEWAETGTPGYDKGMEYDFIIVNPGDAEIYDWQAEINFGTGFVIDSSWNGTFEASDGRLTVKPDERTAVLQPEEEKTFGLVMISLNEQQVLDYSLYYKANYKYTDSPAFWLVAAALLLTLTVFITDEYNRRRYSKLRKSREEIHAILMDSFTTFANIIDAKDPYTQGHSLRVAEYARLISGKMGYSEEEQERVYWIGMLHDIGKIGITDVILQKPGSLDNEEYYTIQTHVDIGGAILKDFNALSDITAGAQYHHERWDGKGYSKHLKGKEIPQIARIICVADSFDAMTSPRVYRKALTVEFAKEELEKCAGTQFDPEIVPVMIKLIDEGAVPIEIRS
ncbi:MAG: HD domain-containing protein [Lachnospiraceae bacterium]|nr:HD domain-containing protein [Lachnospiraceae bacterium]